MESFGRVYSVYLSCVHRPEYVAVICLQSGWLFLVFPWGRTSLLFERGNLDSYAILE
jgi:hypothetical protein